MNLDMVRPRKKTDDLLLSITTNCEMLFKHTHRKAEETLEVKLTKPRKTFHFNPPILIEGSWMLGLTSLEVYNSIFNITQNIKFELYTDKFDEFSFTKLKGAVEIVNVSNTSPEDLKDDTLGPVIASKKFFC